MRWTTPSPHFGRIDILINSAGIMQAGGIDGIDLDEYRQVIDINLMAHSLYLRRRRART